MNEFKVGDIVRQIQNIVGRENPIAEVIKIEGNILYHRHIGREETCASKIWDFELVSKGERKYADLSHIKTYGIVKFLEGLQ